tara:strand:+ start:3084 stop:4028 length:945 start_codon:yes stop_codon:yes gene_type:complete
MIDFYDDPLGTLDSLSDEQLEAVKTASVHSGEELSGVPDNRFALVIRDGSSKLRRYLCKDAASTTLSVASFNLYGGSLPEGMRKVASVNLERASILYDVEGPTYRADSAVSGNVVVGKPPTTKTVVREDPVKEAAGLGDWFDLHYHSLPLEKVREVAVAIRERMESQGVPVFGKVASYSGSAYGAGFQGAMNLRKHLVTDSGARDQAIYILEKHAQFEPTAMVRLLTRFDKEHGLERFWGAKVPDPWETVYSSDKPYVKTASAEDSFLDKLVGKEAEVRRVFGDRFLDDLKKDPTTVVNALPDPEKDALTSMLA